MACCWVGNITAYAGGTPEPDTSNVNYVQGQTVPNSAIVPVGADRTVSFTNNSTGTVQLIADTSGYYLAPATGQPGPHRLQSMTSTPATGTPTTNSFTWDAAGRMTGRAGETLSYTPDGKLATTTGTSSLTVNPNPSATAGTPPAPVTGTAGSTGTRYYDAGGNLVGLTDGTGTTITLGSITAYSTPGGVQTATKSYTFAGKTVAQRMASGGTVKLAFIISDGVDTAQTIVQASSGTTPVTAQTRYTDPTGLARGPTQAAAGSGAYATAAAGVLGVGSNAANPNGYGAANGYIGGLADTISTLTHLGARDLDPVLGAFTSPDPVLHADKPAGFTPYAYSANDPTNFSDPSGLDWWGDVGNWFHDNAGTIVGVATAIVVTAVVATVATACVASVVCGIAVLAVAGAVGAAAGYAAGTAVDVAVGNRDAPSQDEYWGGMAQAAGWGALGGAIGGGFGYALGKAAPAIGQWAGNLASRAASNAPRLISAARQAAADSAQVTENLSNQAAAGAAKATGGSTNFSAGTNGALRDPITGRFASNPDRANYEPGPSFHGNAKASPAQTYLYRLEDNDGSLLKWGITNSLKGRYSQSFLADKNLVPMTSGSRSDMLNLERWIVERNPGPLNREPWAGDFE